MDTSLTTLFKRHPGFNKLNKHTQQELHALVNTDYAPQMPGDFHSGIKVAKDVCLKTLPTEDTPIAWLNKAHARGANWPDFNQRRKQLTQASLNNAKANIALDKKLNMPGAPPLVTPHLGAFRVRPNSPLAKVLTPGVQLVMQRVHGVPLVQQLQQAKNPEQRETLWQRLHTLNGLLKTHLGPHGFDKNEANYLVDPTTLHITRIDAVNYPIRLSLPVFNPWIDMD
jgi:hypothetical protein